MNYLQAIIMEIAAKFAEFLPISSSGHLAIFSKIFGLSEPDLTFDILLHVGTLLAIFIVYWNDIKKLVIEGFGIIGDFFVNAAVFVKKLFTKDNTFKIPGKCVNTSYRKFVMLIIVSTIPTGVIRNTCR